MEKFTAHDARKITKKSELFIKEMRSINEQIKIAAAKGKFDVELYPISDLAESCLRSNGFTVTTSHGMIFETIIISWGDTDE